MPCQLSVGQCGTLACLLEAAAPKPGNVHRGADFADLTFTDFAVSACLVGEILNTAPVAGVGLTVWRAIEVTRLHVGVNTNLGIVLLIAPLAAVPRGEPLQAGIRGVLANLTADDARLVYAAICHAGSRSLGHVEHLDVFGEAPPDLLVAMRAAAERDLIARQYVEHFGTLFERVVPWLVAGRATGWTLTEAIVHTHVRLLSEEPDSLIVRKCGRAVAAEVSARAAAVLAAGDPGQEAYYEALADLDFWLRCDGHRRNPGTTADMLAAALFVVLREGLVAPPYR